MWSLPGHAWKSTNIRSCFAIVFTLICDKNVLMLTNPHKIFLLTVIDTSLKGPQLIFHWLFYTYFLLFAVVQ